MDLKKLFFSHRYSFLLYFVYSIAMALAVYRLEDAIMSLLTQIEIVYLNIIEL